jgi:aminoglycoside 6-adenylyltransferase
MIMRSEQEMLALVADTAKDDERIRAVVLDGSRANPNAKRNVFQDYDVVYIVTGTSSYKMDPDRIKCFGDLNILQMPDEMYDPPPGDSERFAYLRPSYGDVMEMAGKVGEG